MIIPSAYELVEKRKIEELLADGYLLSHKKTGARVLCIECEDDNKVFSVAFRTTPEDSTGVAHIIEHTVLCGSDKYPAKDPFVELVKGSLNTFLNAMTYPDKTVYPVASCNDQDFKNLMSVYMDAVFHPNIYKTKTFFEQEGWHYELESEDAPLIYNGVVYNEMKGAYSSADDCLAEEIKQALYPDNAYSKDSGGKPSDIPYLTYDNYIKFHQTYYHPTNSYIYLYGNCDMAERLEWIDREYLSNYDRIEIDSTVKLQKSFDEPVFKKAQYGITEDEDTADNTFLSVNWVVGDTSSTVDMMALGILEYALMDAPGAPIKEKLLKAGIGSDVYGGYNDSFRQPYFNIIAREANEEDCDKFTQIITDTLTDLVKNGLDKDTLLAGLNNSEFRAREADFGGYPKGLIFGLDSLNTWLYDDSAAFTSVCFMQYYDKLRELLKTDYFEKLIEEKLLNNPHAATVVMVPVKGLNDAEDKKTEEKLALIKASMTSEQIQEIINHTKELKKFQDTPSSEEDLLKIPLLSISDVSKEARKLYITEKEIAGVKTIHSEVFSSGISYVNLSFDAMSADPSDVPYISLLRSFMLLLSTKKHTYAQLGNEILIKTGGIGSSLGVYARNKKVNLRFEVALKALAPQLGDGIALINEVINETLFTDYDRMHELIMSTKSRLASTIMERGDLIGGTRCASYYSDEAWVNDAKGGIAFYQLLDELDKKDPEEFKAVADMLKAKMSELIGKIFCRENLVISYTGSNEDYEAFANLLPGLLDTLPATAPEKTDWVISKEKKNEAFKTSSQVNYICRTGNFKKADPDNKYSGALNVLKVWLGYEYLWVNIRVKGGAYGCFAQFSRQGAVRFSSYRDPKVSETSEVFLNAAQAISKLSISPRDLTKYILGAINEMDAPQTPSRKGMCSFTAYMSGITQDMLQSDRDQVLATTVEDLRALSKLIGDAMAQGYICAVGNANQIEENKELFNQTVSIFK